MKTKIDRQSVDRLNLIRSNFTIKYEFHSNFHETKKRD